jgi:hypothetical protein
LRLPQQTIIPQAPNDDFDAVICFSSPMAKELLPDQLVEMFIQQIPRDLARVVTFHLFADAAVQPLLQAVRNRFGEEFRIRIYNPEEAPDLKDVPNPDRLTEAIENPWLLWIRDSLREQTADVVHFLCHGYVRRGHGALALAESPIRNVNRNWAGFIFSPELSVFLNEVGAWSVAFTSPPGNESVAGLRLLQHEIAQLRPGPVLLHDMESAAQSDLGSAYRFLYTQDSMPPVLSRGITLYCHPNQALSSDSQDEASNQILRDYTLLGKVRAVKQSAWVATSQRILEQAAERVSAASEKSTAEVRAGADNALRWVSELIAKHAAQDESKEKK